MKIVRAETLIDCGPFSKSQEWTRIKEQITGAIKMIQWPPASGHFFLHDQSGKKRGQGNRVKPIKEACMLHLKSFGWSLETRVNFATSKRPEPVDATYRVENRLF